MLVEELLACLEKTPAILKDLVESVPKTPSWRLKERLVEGKWSIHEHACHIVSAQPMLTERAMRFIEEEHPSFKSFIPGKTTPPDELLNMDLDRKLAEFPGLRNKFIELVRSAPAEAWEKSAGHEEYSEYTFYIMLRHILTHDHLHMYRMEELWLTRDKK
jgi:hypothetical protein